MKPFHVLLVIFGCVSARGSGPYLPSGWRPAGPHFYLPSEVKTAGSIEESHVFPETEASGSDTLREYGPPKVEEVLLNINEGPDYVAAEQKPELPETEVSGSDALKEYGPPKLEEVLLNINQGSHNVAAEQKTELPETEVSGSDALKEYGPPKLEQVFLNINQGLPDVATEQAFFVEAKSEGIVAAIEDAVNVNASSPQIPVTGSEISTATKSQLVETLQITGEQTIELDGIQLTTTTENLNDVEHVEAITETNETKDIDVQEEIVVSTVTLEGITTTTVEKEATVVPTAESEEIVITTTGKDDLVVPITERDIVVPITNKDDVVGSITESEETDGSITEKDETVGSITEKEVIEVPIAEKDVIVVPIVEKEEIVVPLYLQELVQDAYPTAAVEESINFLTEKELAQDAASTNVSKETTDSVNQVKEERVDVLLTSRPEENGEQKTEGVNNIVEAIVNLENKVKAAEEPVIGEISLKQKVSGPVQQTPEGFPDSGPSGFAVYGPPQQDNLAQETLSNVLQRNDARRRRFSPRLRFAERN